MSAVAWSAEIRATFPGPEAARRCYRSLRPELLREVPRAVTRVAPPRGRLLRLQIDAADTGAMRAAVNTHLGWLGLVGATARVLASEAAET